MSKTLLELLDERDAAVREMQQRNQEIHERFLTKPVLKALQKHFGCDWSNLDFALNASGQVPMMNIEVHLPLEDVDDIEHTLSVNIPLDELEFGTVPDYLKNLHIRRMEEYKAAAAKRVEEEKARFEAGREKREKRELKRLLKKYPQGK